MIVFLQCSLCGLLVLFVFLSSFAPWVQLVCPISFAANLIASLLHHSLLASSWMPRNAPRMDAPECPGMPRNAPEWMPRNAPECPQNAPRHQKNAPRHQMPRAGMDAPRPRCPADGRILDAPRHQKVCKTLIGSWLLDFIKGIFLDFKATVSVISTQED